MPKITKSVIDKLTPKPAEYFVWDSELRGFGLRISPKGKKSFAVQYRHNGETRRQTLGTFGPITADQARAAAHAIISQAANGIDPKANKSVSKGITVSELCDIYLRDGVGHKKPSTLRTDVGRIERHIKPALGRLAVTSMTRQDVMKFVQDVTNGKTAVHLKTKSRGKAVVRGGGGTAARTVGLLGGIITYGNNALGLRTDNPVNGVARRKDAKRFRLLMPDEFLALSQGLDDAQASGVNFVALAAIRMLLWTGARKGEVLTLKWTDVDAERGQLRLADSKTGQKTIQLPKQAVDLITKLPKLEGSVYVFPSNRGPGHLVGLQKIWTQLCRSSGLTDLRLHDLRHAYASTAAATGLSLFEIGRLLGHKHPSTTQIYTHIADTNLANSAQLIGDRIEAMLKVDRR